MDALYAQPSFQQVAGSAWRPGGTALTAHYLDKCAFAPGAWVADVGCGCGASLSLMHARGLRAVGLDCQGAPASFCCPEAAFVLGNASQIPFCTESLDGLLCECVLSLVPQAHAALSEFYRVLRPGAVLLLADIFVRERPETPPPVSALADSCLSGAVSLRTQEARLRAAHFALRHVADHSEALRDLAAQLVWHGAAPEALRQWLGRGCSAKGAHRGGRFFGYAVWIAVKE